MFARFSTILWSYIFHRSRITSFHSWTTFQFLFVKYFRSFCITLQSMECWLEWFIVIGRKFCTKCWCACERVSHTLPFLMEHYACEAILQDTWLRSMKCHIDLSMLTTTENNERGLVGLFVVETVPRFRIYCTRIFEATIIQSIAEKH